MIERRIKELSFTLEALSRINKYQASVQYDLIEDLLSKLIQKAREDFEIELNPLQEVPPAPLKSTKSIHDDEIPF